MDRPHPWRTTLARTTICCGITVALIITGAQVAVAEPVDPSCESSTAETPETTEPGQSTESPTIPCPPTPTVTDEPTVPETPTPETTTPTESAAPEADTDIPDTATDAPETSGVPVAGAAPTAAPVVGDGITISVLSVLSGSPDTVQPGQTWTGTVSMGVSNVDVNSGWASTVSLSNPQGLTTGTVFTPTSATYSAPESKCVSTGGTSSATTVSLTPDAAEAKSGPEACDTTWDATVAIAVPATGVVADTYSTTLTHSIY